MFKINDYVVFGSNGVCKIIDIRKENFTGDAEREYYILCPENSNNSTIYVPTDNEDAGLRKLLKREIVLAMINKLPKQADKWINDNQNRRQIYNNILQSGDQEEMLRMICVLNERQADLESQGKKLAIQDGEFKKTAESLIFCEFAKVLGLQQEQVVSMVLSHS